MISEAPCKIFRLKGQSEFDIRCRSEKCQSCPFEDKEMLGEKARITVAACLLSVASLAYGQGAFTGPCQEVRAPSITNTLNCQDFGGKCTCTGIVRVYTQINHCQNTNKNACTLANRQDHYSYLGISGNPPCRGNLWCSGSCVQDLTTRWPHNPVWQSC